MAKWRWKIQIYFNSKSLSYYTPKDEYPISTLLKDEHNSMTRFGADAMKESKIVICTLVRGIADRFTEIKKRAEKVGSQFKDYRIIVVENNSEDGSRKLLNEWRKKNNRIIILGCGVNSDIDTCNLKFAARQTDDHMVDRSRIEKMVKLRNIYMEYLKENESEYSDFDYVIVWDMDIVGSIYLDGIANSLGWMNSKNSYAKNADGMCAYGIGKIGFFTMYYDRYAHIDYGDEFHINTKPVHDLKKWLSVRYDNGTPPVKVISCFGGFTIYRFSSIIRDDIEYDMSPPDNLECEHVRLNSKLKNIYMNPSMIYSVLKN